MTCAYSGRHVCGTVNCFGMQRATQLIFRSGCLVSVLLLIIGAVLYPRAKWLFAFVLVGIALLAIAALTSKKPTPQEMADLAEGIRKRYLRRVVRR